MKDVFIVRKAGHHQKSDQRDPAEKLDELERSWRILPHPYEAAIFGFRCRRVTVFADLQHSAGQEEYHQDHRTDYDKTRY